MFFFAAHFLVLLFHMIFVVMAQPKGVMVLYLRRWRDKLNKTNLARQWATQAAYNTFICNLTMCPEVSLLSNLFRNVTAVQRSF